MDKQQRVVLQLGAGHGANKPSLGKKKVMKTVQVPQTWLNSLSNGVWA
jgi:hypothetical protein